MNLNIPKNLHSIHKEEERIRELSLKEIQNTHNLIQHLEMIYEAMDIIYLYVKGYKNLNKEELTIQKIGIRLFNSISSSIKLGLSGYYQSAFSHIRDVFETVQLLDFLVSNPSQINVWEKSTKKDRMNKFSPFKIRVALDKRDSNNGKKREEAYNLLCEYATHVTSEGFKLVVQDNLFTIGPFYDIKLLSAWLNDTSKYTVYGAVVFISYFNLDDSSLLSAKIKFIEKSDIWYKSFQIKNISKK